MGRVGNILTSMLLVGGIGGGYANIIFSSDADVEKAHECWEATRYVDTGVPLDELSTADSRVKVKCPRFLLDRYFTDEGLDEDSSFDLSMDALDNYDDVRRANDSKRAGIMLVFLAGGAVVGEAYNRSPKFQAKVKGWVDAFK